MSTATLHTSPAGGSREPSAGDFPYDHAVSGTCVPGCRRWSWCHCSAECDGRPSLALQNHRRGHSAPATRGYPRVFVRGHNPKHAAGCWSANGVPIERIRPLIRWAKARYGMPQAARLMGVPLSTLDALLYTRTRRHCSRGTARIIAGFVQAHRRPSDPLAIFDTVQRRMPTPAERSATRRAEAAAHQRDYRSRKASA